MGARPTRNYSVSVELLIRQSLMREFYRIFPRGRSDNVLDNQRCDRRLKDQDEHNRRRLILSAAIQAIGSNSAAKAT